MLEVCYNEEGFGEGYGMKAYTAKTPQELRTALREAKDEEGCVDFPEVFRLLEEYDYSGWLIVEAEQDPEKANPLDYARMAREYERRYTGL